MTENTSNPQATGTTDTKAKPAKKAPAKRRAKNATKAPAKARTAETVANAEVAVVSPATVASEVIAETVVTEVIAEVVAEAVSPTPTEVVTEPEVQVEVEAVAEVSPEPEPTPEPEPALAPKVAKPSMPTSRLLGITPRPLLAGNPYTPAVSTVKEVIREAGNIVTIRAVIDDEEAMQAFTHEPGQVGQLSLFGVGESTFVINSPPSCKEYIQFSVMKTGEVTDAIHKLNVGDKIGVRAPLGNSFPYADWKGKNIVFIGGGIGMAPIRTIMLHVLENKADYGKVSLLYGARSPRDMAFSYELDSWLANPDLDCNLCIDAPFEGWAHKVGMIPHVLTDMNPSPDNTVAVLCGPPIMIKFTVQALEKLGFAPENIVTTLEKRMKCGIGICGRCNIGGRFVCVDGPVFTWAELKELPPDM